MSELKTLMWCWCSFRVSLIWAPPTLWWCLTGRASFTLSSSSSSSTACSRGLFKAVSSQLVHCVFSESCQWNLFTFCPCRKSYRRLGLLWTGSSIAHQIVLIPGVVIGKSCLQEHLDSSHCCLCLLFVVDVALVVQVNLGLTFVQPLWGTLPSFWCLSGWRSCSSAGPERCLSSQQTRSDSTVKALTVICVCRVVVSNHFPF